MKVGDKVFMTKYVLSVSGVQICTVSSPVDKNGMVGLEGFPLTMRFKVNRDVHMSAEEAVHRTIVAVDVRLRSFRNQVKKLESVVQTLQSGAFVDGLNECMKKAKS